MCSKPTQCNEVSALNWKLGDADSDAGSRCTFSPCILLRVKGKVDERPRFPTTTCFKIEAGLLYVNNTDGLGYSMLAISLRSW